MKVPDIQSFADWQFLINYKLDAAALKAVVPKPFRPLLFHGSALISLSLLFHHKSRPKGIYSLFKFVEDNLCYRLPVEWNEGNEPRNGFLLLKRFTSSRKRRILSGKVFAGSSEFRHFSLIESNGGYYADVKNKVLNLAFSMRETEKLAESSLLSDTETMNRFLACFSFEVFQAGDHYESAQQLLEMPGMHALETFSLQEALLESGSLIEKSAVKFDSAFVMKDVKQEWHYRGQVV